jgi:dTDP-4-amino-4,6-dideoxygalactose transaminase
VGIIPVHLYGQPANMDEIMRIAKKNKLWVIEDCAQAHLAKYKGQTVGSFGDAAAFSFYPGKNLGAMGDAGAVLTRHKDLADRMAMYARHGGLTKGAHLIEGINSRLDGLQAAILSVKLAHLLAWTIKRQNIAKAYTRALSGIDSLILPKVRDACEHVFHLYVVQHEKRDQLAKYLIEHGVQNVVNYPTALPFLPAYSYLGNHKEDFPNSYANQSRVLSIPIFPELIETQMITVINTIKNFCNGSR